MTSTGGLGSKGGTRKRRAPILENPYQRAALNFRLHNIFRHICEPQARERGVARDCRKRCCNTPTGSRSRTYDVGWWNRAVPRGLACCNPVNPVHRDAGLRFGGGCQPRRSVDYLDGAQPWKQEVGSEFWTCNRRRSSAKCG